MYGSNGSQSQAKPDIFFASSSPVEISSNAMRPREKSSANHNPRRSGKLSHDEFVTRTSEDERNLLKFEVNCAIQHFLEQSRPVYLEHFGIVYPRTVELTKSYVNEAYLLVRQEKVKTLSFEKCDDTVGLPPSITCKLVQISEITKRIYPRLPIQLQFRWSDSDLQTLLRSFIGYIRQRVVSTGSSSMLASIGDIFALHNRQGSTPTEWYAGADIFLKQRQCAPISVGKFSKYRRPIVVNAWEALEAAYGPKIQTFEFKVGEILEELGFTPDITADGGQEVNRKLEVALFRASWIGERQQSQRFVYCTNGLRELGLARQKGASLGNELIFQTEGLEHTPKNLPKAVCHALTLGWILLHGNKNKTLKTGIGIASKSPLGVSGSNLHAIFTTNFADFRYEQLSETGPFLYINIIGITQDESNLINQRRRNHLLAALESRGLDQVTRLRRSSVFARTEIEVPLALAS